MVGLLILILLSSFWCERIYHVFLIEEYVGEKELLKSLGKVEPLKMVTDSSHIRSTDQDPSTNSEEIQQEKLVEPSPHFEQEKIGRRSSALRVPTENLSGAPFSAVGKLFVKFGSNEHFFGCTGSIIGKNKILTAARCVFDKKTRRFASQVIFVPRYDGEAVMKYNEIYFGKEMFIPGEFVDEEVSNYADFGIIKMKENDDQFENGQYMLGVTYTELGGWRQEESKKVLLADSSGTDVVGYPAEQPFHGDKMWTVRPIMHVIPDRRDGLCAGIPSPMTAGSAGGPWVGSVGGEYGYIFGLNSYTYDSEIGLVFGPVFPGRIMKPLYQVSEGVGDALKYEVVEIRDGVPPDDTIDFDPFFGDL